MIYVLHAFILSLILVLDIGLVAMLNKYSGPWPTEGAITYMVELLVAPFFLLVCGIKQISNFLFNTSYEI